MAAFDLTKSHFFLIVTSANTLLLVSSQFRNGNFNIMKWWKLHENELPYWSAAIKKVVLIQPSSAASERILNFF